MLEKHLENCSYQSCTRLHLLCILGHILSGVHWQSLSKRDGLAPTVAQWTLKHLGFACKALVLTFWNWVSSPTLDGSCKAGITNIQNHRMKASRDGDSTTSLGTLLQCLTTLQLKHFFKYLIWTSPGAAKGHFLLSFQLRYGRRDQPQLTTNSFWVAVGVIKSSQPCQVPQPLLLGRVFQSLPQQCPLWSEEP